MKTSILFGMIAATVVAASSTNASAQCRERLWAYEAQGRNAWAAMWGYITPDEEMTLNQQGNYVEFFNGCYRLTTGGSCSTIVPITGGSFFVPGLMTSNFCPRASDCYTPDQQIMMGGEYIGIENAANLGSPTVTTLAENATMENPVTLDQPVASISWAPVTEQIYVLEGDSGERLEVTGGHPMALADGTMRSARDLKEGDTLAGENGAIIGLARMGTYKYEGKVWNLLPKSEKKAENIVFAEGFLAGSMRFQTQWANERYRLFVRDRVNVKDLLATETN